MSLQDQIDNAPEATTFRYTNIGLLTISFVRGTWQGKGEAPLKEDYVDGMTVGDGQFLEMRIEVDPTHINPTRYIHTRNVQIVRSSGSRLTSFSETVEPSLIAVFGKNWVTATSGQYVAFQDVDNSEGREKDDGSLWGVPKFIAKYASLAEATRADADLRNGGNAASSSVDLSELVEEARQLATALQAKERGPVFGAMNDSGRLAGLTGEQINDIFTQAGL